MASKITGFLKQQFTSNPAINNKETNLLSKKNLNKKQTKIEETIKKAFSELKNKRLDEFARTNQNQVVIIQQFSIELEKVSDQQERIQTLNNTLKEAQKDYLNHAIKNLNKTIKEKIDDLQKASQAGQKILSKTRAATEQSGYLKGLELLSNFKMPEKAKGLASETRQHIFQQLSSDHTKIHTIYTQVIPSLQKELAGSVQDLKGKISAFQKLDDESKTLADSLENLAKAAPDANILRERCEVFEEQYNSVKEQLETLRKTSSYSEDSFKTSQRLTKSFEKLDDFFSKFQDKINQPLEHFAKAEPTLYKFLKDSAYRYQKLLATEKKEIAAICQNLDAHHALMEAIKNKNLTSVSSDVIETVEKSPLFLDALVAELVEQVLDILTKNPSEGLLKQANYTFLKDVEALREQIPSLNAKTKNETHLSILTTTVEMRKVVDAYSALKTLHDKGPNLCKIDESTINKVYKVEKGIPKVNFGPLMKKIESQLENFMNEHRKKELSKYLDNIREIFAKLPTASRINAQNSAIYKKAMETAGKTGGLETLKDIWFMFLNSLKKLKQKMSKSLTMKKLEEWFNKHQSAQL
ncbi:MAG: hypothetical protein ACM3JI_03150 [Anaerolineae bacterium]